MIDTTGIGRWGYAFRISLTSLFTGGVRDAALYHFTEYLRFFCCIGLISCVKRFVTPSHFQIVLIAMSDVR